MGVAAVTFAMLSTRLPQHESQTLRTIWIALL